MIKDKEENFSIKAIENIFMTWKYFVSDRKRAAQRLSELIKLNQRQIGFDAIRDLDWSTRVLMVKSKVLGNYHKIWVRRVMLNAINTWK